MKTKRCNICRRELPPTEFHRWSKSPDGLDIYCKDCRRRMYASSNAHVTAEDLDRRDREVTASLRAKGLRRGFYD